MKIANVPYKSFCWVLGTISFRAAKLNLKIEQQLLLLNEFYEGFLKSHDSWSWVGNENTQISYYDLMKEKSFLSGDAPNKAKDAREKTSGLVDIGLVNKDRTITEVGYELLEISKKRSFFKNNSFSIDNDSYIYFKQLIKTTILVDNCVTRPFLILAKVLTELDYLTYEEFTYLLPLAITVNKTKAIISEIKKLRKNLITIEEIIYNNLIQMKNYKKAKQMLYDNKVTENLICAIGMNRKSRAYDKPYYALFNNIKAVFIEKNYDRVLDIYKSSREIKQKPGVLWRKFLFKTSNYKGVKKNGIKAIQEHSPFFFCNTEKELKLIFFKYMHIFKTMATLSDYFDLNRRYLNLTDTLLFEDQIVKFDLIPRYFFTQCIDKVYLEAYTMNSSLAESISMEEISSSLFFNETDIYKRISEDLGVTIETADQAMTFIKDERYRRFSKLIDRKFTKPILIELLECFKTRNDARIEELVTDEADIPTIFEYILAIIWFKVSEKRGNILEFMKLSLEANLLPKSHAVGGLADIVYEYEACEEYPKHSLLIEATLTDGKTQRRAEMEPVSRHLGEYRVKSGNPFDYSLFISTYLDKNVISDFRYRKNMPYYGIGDEKIPGMKIISLDTDTLKIIIKKSIKYRYLYGVFDSYHELPLDEEDWFNGLIKDATKNYFTI